MKKNAADVLTEEELIGIYRRSKVYPSGRCRVTIIDKDYVPAGARDLADAETKAFNELIGEFLSNHESISIDDIPDDYLLRSCLLGLKSHSTSLRSKSLDYLMQLKSIGKYTPPPPKEEREEDDPEDHTQADVQSIMDELGL